MNRAWLVFLALAAAGSAQAEPLLLDSCTEPHFTTLRKGDVVRIECANALLMNGEQVKRIKAERETTEQLMELLQKRKGVTDETIQKLEQSLEAHKRIEQLQNDYYDKLELRFVFR